MTDLILTPVRVCAKCGTADRYASGVCKACRKAASRKFYAGNKDKVKVYLAENKDRIALRNKARLGWHAIYREKNKARIRIADAARRKKNPSARNSAARYAAAKVWKIENPELCRVYSQNRRAKTKALGGKLSIGLIDRLLVLQRGLCPCCGNKLGVDFHMDHKMPIALGGDNTDGNIQLLRKVCNQQKSAKHPIDFMQERGFLL